MKKQICVPIDIETCGSAVMGYVTPPKIEKGTNRWYVACGGTVVLSDCSRQIHWDLTSYRGQKELYNIKKIDRAIKALSAIRDAMVENEKGSAKLQAICKKHNDEKAAKEKKKGTKVERT